MDQKDPDQGKRGNPIATFARYATIGFTLPAATFTGYLLGYWLDRSFGTGYLRVVFLLLGTVAGFIQVIRGLTSGRP